MQYKNLGFDEMYTNNSEEEIFEKSLEKFEEIESQFNKLNGAAVSGNLRRIKKISDEIIGAVLEEVDLDREVLDNLETAFKELKKAAGAGKLRQVKNISRKILSGIEELLDFQNDEIEIDEAKALCVQEIRKNARVLALVRGSKEESSLLAQLPDELLVRIASETDNRIEDKEIRYNIAHTFFSRPPTKPQEIDETIDTLIRFSIKND